MNKKSLVVLSAVLAIGFAAVGLPRLIQFLTPSDTSSVEEEPRYERVEAERYEIQIPLKVNDYFTYGCLYVGDFAIDDGALFGLHSFDDEDCHNVLIDGFVLRFIVYIDGLSMSETTDQPHIEQGSYGRYVISETQVAEEPVAFTLEPLYEYVLV